MSRMRKKHKERATAGAVAVATETDEPALEPLDPSEAGSDEPGEVDLADDGSDDEDLAGDDSVEGARTDEARRRRPKAEPEQLKSVIESLLFAANKPITVKQIRSLTREKNVELIEAALAEIATDYDGRGVVVHEVAGGYQFRTHPDNSDFVQQLVAGRPVRLTRAQLETLSICAYRQPITRPEIDDIRGVDSGGTLRVLLDRHLIRVLGKKEEPGRPLLYGTTKAFLEFFNLNDLRDLPTLREYHELSEDSMRVVEQMGMNLSDLKGGAFVPDDDENTGVDEAVVSDDDPGEADASDDDEPEVDVAAAVAAEADTQAESAAAASE